MPARFTQSAYLFVYTRLAPRFSEELLCQTGVHDGRDTIATDAEGLLGRDTSQPMIRLDVLGAQIRSLAARSAAAASGA